MVILFRLVYGILLIQTLFFCSLLQDTDEEDDCTEGYAPFDCDTQAPDYGTLEIQVTTDVLNPAVKIEVFRGDVEDGRFLFADTISAKTEYRMKNNYLSVRATYIVSLDENIITVYSIDGGDLDYSSDDYCDATCYYEGYLELKPKLDYGLLEP